MDSINIGTTKKRVCINGDETRVVEFDPADVYFAERFYKIYQDINEKFNEIKARGDEIETRLVSGEADAESEGIAMIREMCQFMVEKIDYLFGPGTYETVFGDSMNLDAIIAFLEGISPYIFGSRESKVKKYTNRQSSHTLR